MNVLAIDSSNLVMGVAVVNNQKVLGELITNVKKNHSVRLMPAIEQILRDVDMTPNGLDRIAVAHGPGSYTGVRIGVTIAKTLAWTLNKELVGVSSLEVLAQNGRSFNGYVVPFFDARRGQVYTGLYKSANGIVKAVEPDKLTMLDMWLTQLAKLGEPLLFLSNDLDKHSEMIDKYCGALACLAELTGHNPRPSELAWLGLQREPVQDIHLFTPQYLQLAEAEAKWLANRERS
ncbi:tRNA threonylcarbamoyladenosine biosynthesis protein TsaB [Scopulibacillus darangshiensis]|uniref:tRNA threonylcarbamoyladenosine biosynthesis protein TsaB n=1 Tax=Scopulibacillus darangshiensis TaxID=442528 RepID=A0A4R2NES2_9BACL|nr:tRNA (adenosine(37)-N6)-threonylcarbamoyltransferase complex dimerization subunit type 1 TsaB [Scopulibacillus darangshiensis]TCP19720.1 tRNA threonylcarbamoyladenosine biosynthesis protein TsaB [Scopulibacillus darangshiensis]